MPDNLEKTGIVLQAQGFNEYVKKLSDIDKKQREVFDRDYKGLGLSYSKVISASKQYERQLGQELKALQRSERERQRISEQAQRDAARQQRESQRASRDRLGGANLAFAGIAAGLTVAAVKGLDLAKQGAQFEAQEAALANLAGSFGQASSEITAAMQRASNGVLSNSAIMQAANKALLLEVAQTPEEFERVTRNAIVLGRTLGLTATDSIDQFTTALGRKSLLILDNFGIKMEQVNRELDRLGRQEFGVGLEGLSSAQKDALFVEAALSAADNFTKSIGDNADSAAVQIERMAAGADNAKVQFGLLLKDLGQSTGLFAGLAGATQGIADTIQATRVGFGGGSLQDDIAVTRKQIEELQKLQAEGPVGFGDVGGVLNQARAAFAAPDGGTTEDQIRSLQTHLDALLTIEKNRAAAVPQATASTEAATEATEENTEALKKQEEALKRQQQAIRQAEGIALNFARAQEDAARQLARAQEDAARRLGRSQAKLAEDQAKARDKLLQGQQKELDKFEADAIKDRTKAQADATKREAELRKNAAKQQADEQRRLFVQLKQAQERFDLDRLQSRRRFALSDRRLRAEGDILGLQELRENFELEQQEATENFGLDQRQTRENAAQQKQEQARDLDEQLQELRTGLAEQNAEFEANLATRRQELLTSFDEQFADLQTSQQEQRDELMRSYQEQLEDLAFSRQRQEEDLRLSYQRQLEDLGRSFVDMEGVTQEGAQKLAGQLELAFGIEGSADVIMQGFAERTESRFQSLFENIGRDLTPFSASTTPGTAPSRRGRTSADPIDPYLPVIAREHGGPVSPAGGPYLVGEAGPEIFNPAGAGNIIPNRQTQQVMTMLAPVVSSQNINVRVGGGFAITGGGGGAMAPEVQTALKTEIVEEVRIALQRVKRRG